MVASPRCCSIPSISSRCISSARRKCRRRNQPRRRASKSWACPVWNVSEGQRDLPCCHEYRSSWLQISGSSSRHVEVVAPDHIFSERCDEGEMRFALVVAQSDREHHGAHGSSSSTDGRDRCGCPHLHEDKLRLPGPNQL